MILVVSFPSSAQQNISIDSNDAVLSVDVYPSRGDTLLIWLPPEGGFQAVHTNTAQRLAAQGTEVWLVDLFEAHFLSPVASSLAQIPPSDVSSLIDAGQQTGKSVQLVSSGRGIQPLLRGTHLWQQSHPDATSFHGAILLSPQFYTETPEPGEPAELLPVVRHTNLPLFILQPRLSPWFWKLEQTVPALQEGGSDVFVRLLPDVRDRFHYRPDATVQEQSLGETLATLLTQASNLLNHLPTKTRSVSSFTDSSRQLDSGKKERRLRTYLGDPRPPSLALPDLQGKQHTLPFYQGKIVLVNFWASWCPPCVHEMPSMQRLANKLDPDAFSILAVNMAESKTAIEQFLHTKVQVNFPILLDRDGAALKRWGVFAFPTSYVIDKKGNIRYALFGSVEWDSEEMLKTFSTLIREP
ncbi:MAG: TlpA disulfide reductase family protein [Thiohalomonadales bacterium]|nr:TlpA disulfide reductase family protein [Thiohalomonadales bacterium]